MKLAILLMCLVFSGCAFMQGFGQYYADHPPKSVGEIHNEQERRHPSNSGSCLGAKPVPPPLCDMACIGGQWQSVCP